jgi:quinol monooxygenase YgiN
MHEPVIHFVARLVPRPDRVEALADAIQAILPAVRAEPGCLAYLAHSSLDAPGVIVMVEAWASQAALNAHVEAHAFGTLAARFDELLAEPLHVERLYRLD